MNPHSKPRPLIFTPRSPWGRFPQKHAHQSHMRASEDKKPVPTIAGNNVPSSLQSQITPERAGEIMNPSPQPPLSAKPAPSLKDPPYQPPPPSPQTLPAQPGSGVLRPGATGQQTPVDPNNYTLPAAPPATLQPPAFHFKNGEIGPDFEEMFKSRGPALKGKIRF